MAGGPVGLAEAVLGPHFEELDRQWCFGHAVPEPLGGRASWVRPTEIACREHRHGHELDLAAARSPVFGSERITAIGEAEGTLTPAGLPQPERLRGLLPGVRREVSKRRLAQLAARPA